MTDELVYERRDLFLKLVRLALDLFERFGETVSDAHVLAIELPHQLDVVIAGDAQSFASFDHVHRQTQYVCNPWATIDEIAEKDHLAAFRMLGLSFRDL